MSARKFLRSLQITRYIGTGNFANGREPVRQYIGDMSNFSGWTVSESANAHADSRETNASLFSTTPTRTTNLALLGTYLVRSDQIGTNCCRGEINRKIQNHEIVVSWCVRGLHWKLECLVALCRALLLFVYAIANVLSNRAPNLAKSSWMGHFNLWSTFWKICSVGNVQCSCVWALWLKKYTNGRNHLGKNQIRTRTVRTTVPCAESLRLRRTHCIILYQDGFSPGTVCAITVVPVSLFIVLQVQCCPHNSKLWHSDRFITTGFFQQQWHPGNDLHI